MQPETSIKQLMILLFQLLQDHKSLLNYNTNLLAERTLANTFTSNGFLDYGILNSLHWIRQVSFLHTAKFFSWLIFLLLYNHSSFHLVCQCHKYYYLPLTYNLAPLQYPFLFLFNAVWSIPIDFQSTTLIHNVSHSQHTLCLISER